MSCKVLDESIKNSPPLGNKRKAAGPCQHHLIKEYFNYTLKYLLCKERSLYDLPALRP